MNSRERFLATMNYQPRDRVPWGEMGFWPVHVAHRAIEVERALALAERYDANWDAIVAAFMQADTLDEVPAIARRNMLAKWAAPKKPRLCDNSKDVLDAIKRAHNEQGLRKRTPEKFRAEFDKKGTTLAVDDAFIRSPLVGGSFAGKLDLRSQTLDLAEEGEICVGMGHRDLRTKEKEIVFRDEKDIVCVLCQGADEKTRVRDETRNAFFYAYAVPGIDVRHIKEGLTIAAETMAEFGGGNIEGIEIF